HTRFSRDWSSDVCSSDLFLLNILTDTQVGLVRHQQGNVFLAHVIGCQGFFNYLHKAHHGMFKYLVSVHHHFVVGGVQNLFGLPRSEERRVGKEWRSRWM